MRPIRIEIQGFSAYRGAEAVDFEGVDFFSLTGPTGSGKSSLIDAMVFALYGRVPRLGGNAVAPAITAGADRARVRLDFEADGEVYTAVRLAQRTPRGGATVKEARLQKGDEPIASGADEVTGAVQDLLKLTFEDFTRTVVLPQGEFARFLTATKAERQGLLRNLLGMDVYTRVREMAKTREAVAADRADSARRVLEALQPADEEEMRGAIVRRDRLSELAADMPNRETALAEMETAVAAADSESAAITDALARLRSIEVPPRIEELEELVAAARAAVGDAEEAREAAAEELAGLEAHLASRPTIDQLSSWKRSQARLRELTERLADPQASHVAQRADEARTRLERAKAELARSRAALESARREHSAHILVSTLVVGEACPVCRHLVAEMPENEVPASLELIESEVTANEQMVETLAAEAELAATELARSEAMRSELDSQRASLETDLAEAPAEEALERLLGETTDLARAVDEARSRLARCLEEEKKTRSALDDLADDSRRVGKLLTAAQLKVADLGPPVPESDDVVVQWKELVTWRGLQVDRLIADLEQAEKAASDARERAAAGRAELVALLESHEVEAKTPYAVAVAEALHSARALVEAHEKTARDVAELTEQVAIATAEAGVAGALAGHLKANGFEQWLMSGALHDLVSGANELLGQLSGDGYALHSDESGSFSIVDHRNADEIRSVATLSGGETFLVSLALALSLAETLAAKGGAGLDAIILDEGFGSLDEESLDTVATVLEELTGRGLMVGIITHVKDLAARAPVRYEVSRQPGGAVVRLVS